MRIVDIRELSVPISRYADPSVPSGGLTTSVVAVITDVSRDGKPIVGYGFASIGRFAQGGLIRKRFAPRLLAARDIDLMDNAGTNLDPFRAWKVMMSGEKPGGHGERCVAVGALDMALWDATAKIAQLPLYRLLAHRTAGTEVTSPPVYAGGGYYYPTDDVGRFSDEVRRFSDLGYRRAKIKIGGAPLAQDLKRIDVAARLLDGPDHLAVDAIYAYTPTSSIEAADLLAPLGLWWFEDICDSLDFETLAAVARCYTAPIATGEALFSRMARLLRLLPDPACAHKPRSVDPPKITLVSLAAVAERAQPLHRTAPSWRTQVPCSGRRRFTDGALAHVRTPGGPTGPAQPLLRLTRSPSTSCS